MKRRIVISEKYTNINTKSFKNYLNEVSKIDKFETEDEEADCAYRALKGDEKAKNELVTRNLRFVISVAKKYENKRAPLADLVNQGNIGLIRAVSRFDPSNGYKFISYAVWWIRSEIMKYLYNLSRVIRIPTNRLSSINKFNEASSKLMQEEGIELTANDMYGRLEGFTNNQIDRMVEIDSLNVLSYDKKISSIEGDTTSMLDLMESPIESTDQMIINKESKTVIDSILLNLNPTQREVIKRYFGIGYDGNAMNISEIANELELTTERVKTIKLRALKLLKIDLKSIELH